MFDVGRSESICPSLSAGSTDMKVLLLKPPKEYQVWAGVPDVFNDQRAHVYPPMGIMQLSAYLKANTRHEILLMDAVPFFWSTEWI